MKQRSTKRILSLLLAVVLLLSLSPQLSAAEAPQDGLNELVGPDEEVLEEISYSGTRIGFCLLAYKIAGEPEVDLSVLDVFTDLTDCSEKELAAAAYAYENQFIIQYSESIFNPYYTLTKAEAITFIWTYYGSPEPSHTEIPFTDVWPNEYYTKAVLWAVENTEWLECFEGASIAFQPYSEVASFSLFLCKEQDESETWKIKVETTVLTSGVCGDELTWSYETDTGVLTIEGSGEMYQFNNQNAPWYALRNEIISVVLPDGLTSIGNGAFYLCSELTMVALPASISTIGSFAFYGCTGLRAVNFPDGLDSIGTEAFSGCTALTEARLPAALRSIGERAFRNCSGMTALTLPVQPDSIGYGAFSFCSSLPEVTIPEGITVLGGYTFLNCTGLKTVNLPENLEVLGWSIFQGCTGLSSITLPAGLKSIGGSAFEGCTGLSSVSFPAALEYMEGYAFSGCKVLTELNLPGTLKGLGMYAFSNCDSLKTVTLPASVEQLEQGVFADCDNLKVLVVRNPNCRVLCNNIIETRYYDESMEDLGDWCVLEETSYDDTLGLRDKLCVYGAHDSEKEDAPAITETDDFGTSRSTKSYRYIENCAKVLGYSFYATNVFSDVKEGKYYEIPVAWAYGEGITSGKDATHFAPNETCTRGQVVTFLWNAMGKPAPTITDCPFVDVKPGKYYYDAMLWALETGVTSGKDDTHFAPNETCTRGQVVTFIWNAMGKPEPTTTDCPFVDVKPGKYYYNAMLWALENGVTSGTDATHFGPNQTCTRGQVVTFLYNTLS